MVMAPYQGLWRAWSILVEGWGWMHQHMETPPRYGASKTLYRKTHYLQKPTILRSAHLICITWSYMMLQYDDFEDDDDGSDLEDSQVSKCLLHHNDIIIVTGWLWSIGWMHWGCIRPTIWLRWSSCSDWLHYHIGVYSDVIPITPDANPGEVSPFTPLARDQKIKAFTAYPICILGSTLKILQYFQQVENFIP